MKKIVYSAAIVCILALAVSCKSTKTEKKASGDNYKKQEVSEIAEEQEERSEERMSLTHQRDGYPESCRHKRQICKYDRVIIISYHSSSSLCNDIVLRLIAKCPMITITIHVSTQT